MIRIAMLALLTLSPVAAPAAAQTPSWAEKMFTAGTTHDHGGVARGAQLYHKFKITNIYAVPLEITNIRASCTCGTVTPSVKVLEPRQEGFIEVLMDTRRFTGPKTISVFVTVGPQFTSTAELKISASSRADVVFNPGEIDFGVVAGGQPATKTVEVEYAGTLDWRISEVVKGTAPLDVTLEEMYRRPGQVGYRVKATLRADAPAGSQKWELFLKTNDPAGQLVPVLAEATVQAPLTVLPDTLKLGTVRLNAESLGRVVVRGSKPFRVVAVEGLGEGITAATPLPTQPATLHTLTFKCQAPKQGDFRHTLQIKTDLQDAPVTVTVEGTAAP